jgi:hypothetical protein
MEKEFESKIGEGEADLQIRMGIWRVVRAVVTMI